MRIIAGELKGRQFHPPKGFKARPTTDFARESLFNILENRIDISELNILDLFAGSGSISYEFCSRGAASVTSVDINPKYKKFIADTMLKLNCKCTKSVCSDSISFVKRCKMHFDLVFCDPPFDFVNYEELHKEIVKNNLLNEEGLLIIEHAKGTDLSQLDNFTELRKYGHVSFSFFQINQKNVKIS